MNWGALNQQLAHNGVFESNGGTTLLFMGSGAACGVPTYYCDCAACREARENPHARRTCSSIAIVRNEVTLIDASPEIHTQLARERMCDVDRVLFTHEHFDHVGGIPQLEYYVRLRRKQPLDFYCNSQTKEHIASHFDFMDDTFNLQDIAVGQTLKFDGISYTAVAASHCPGALGYIITVPAVISATGKNQRVVYIPDTTFLVAETIKAAKDCDILIIDSTFNGGNWMPTQHLMVEDAVQLASDLGARRAYLTHLSMQFDVPITTLELDAKLQGTNVKAAYDGLRLQL